MPHPKARYRVEVHQAVKAGVAPALIRRWVVMAATKLRLPAGEVSIAFVSARDSRTLNSHYRRRDRATNVLTFTWPHSKAATQLGEIIVCPAVVRREVKAGQYQARLKFLLEHGCIHLRGLDHHQSGEIRQWQKLEKLLQS